LRIAEERAGTIRELNGRLRTGDQTILAKLETTALFGVIALCLIQHANAGSAVAVGRNLHLVYSFGWPKQVAEQRALGICRRQGGVDPRIADSTDAVGYGAAAISYQGNHWILGVATGHPTWLEAEHEAIEQCRKRGGTNPQVKWEWKG
jgi:hypothetical protein